jgi:tetratricopeptide (TPR) repeat protein
MNMRPLLCVLCICVLGLQVYADTGETSASFLNLGSGAQSLALAGAVVARSSGVHALYWNPGGLGWLKGTEVTAMHAEYFQSIRYENFGIAYGSRTFGFGFSLTGLYLNGIEERTGPSENPLSTFGAYFMAPTISCARSFGSVALGLNIKGVYQSIGNDNALSFATDLGVSAQPGIPGLKTGVALSNFGSGVSFSQQSYSLPSRVRFGISYALLRNSLVMSCDLVKPFKDDIEFCAGAEATVLERINFRIGYRSGLTDNEGLAGASAGLGVKLSSIDIDYAFATYGVLGLTHYISLSYIFGRSSKVDEQQEQRIAEEFQRRARITAQTFYKQGVNQQTEQRYEDALRSFDIALIWYPTYDEALQRIEEVRKIVQESGIREHLTRGIAYYRSGNYIEALSEFGLVLEIDPDNELAQGWLDATTNSLVKVQMEQIKLAQEIKQKITRHYEQGLAYYSRKDYRNAINEWNQVLALDPTHQESRRYIGQAQIKIREKTQLLLAQIKTAIAQEKWMHGLELANELLSLDPSHQEGKTQREEIRKKLRFLSVDHTQTGIKLYKQGKFGQAATELKVALNYDATNLTAKEYLDKIQTKAQTGTDESVNDLYMKGVNAYTQEKYEIAVLYWKRVLEIDPRHENAQRNIARAEEKLKLYKK